MGKNEKLSYADSCELCLRHPIEVVEQSVIGICHIEACKECWKNLEEGKIMLDCFDFLWWFEDGKLFCEYEEDAPPSIRKRFEEEKSASKRPA